MARARNIKPSLFKNELLGVADPLLTILFQSLWTLADREGRLEDRPLRIKAETFPYRENLDINGYLTELQRLGFIVRYSASGSSFIQVVNFKKHQTPHNTEKASEIPEYVAESVTGISFQETCVNSPLSNDGLTQAKRPDSFNLIPDSLNLIQEKAIVPSDAGDDLPRPEKHECPHQEIIAIYHKVLPQCPRVRDWTPARATQLRARWNEDKKRQALDWWKEFFEYVASCDFLTGRTAKPFFADLEWITKSTNFVKIREGKYENREAA